MFRKDIQDQLCPVDHAMFRRLLDIALLHWREFAVENDQRGLPRRRLRPDFVQFSSSHQRRGIGLVPQLKNRAGDFCPRASCQFDELRQRFAALLPRGHARKPRRAFPADPHQKDSLGRGSIVLCFHV
jgi:hypothetical protein